VKDLVKATKTSHADIKARKTARASREEREKAKQVQDVQRKQVAAAAAAVKEQKRKQKEAQDREAKAKKQQLEELSGKGSVEWTIWSTSLEHHSGIKTFETPKCFEDAVSADKGFMDLPYIIHGLDFEDDLKKVEQILGVWVAGFDRSDVVMQKGRSFWPLNDNALEKRLCSFAPDRLLDIEKDNSSYNKVLSNLCVFGYSAVMKHSGGETQSLGSIGWNREGKRRVIITNVDDIVKYLQLEASPRVPTPVPADVSACLKFADAAVVASLRARGANLFHAEVGAKDFLYQPPGYWVLEMPCSQRNFGLHVSILPKIDKESKAMKGFQAMTEIKLSSIAHMPPMHAKTKRFL
jgi:hypothetical protein